MEFFIPGVSAEEAEAKYAEYAAKAGRNPQPADKRISSLSWTHHSVEDWTAEVGKQLRGTKTVTTGRGANKRDRRELLSDAATVLAIFPGSPYIVVTDKGITPGVRSMWNNPFMATNSPTSSKLFDVSSEPDKEETADKEANAETTETDQVHPPRQ
ncbi:hypothetical protein ANMWB30_23160 [Arthrobacter sp. MWB30]|nr:hypothetical protein ANMWB30_23160 [Arthrobacter sp. MWB30]